MDIKLLSLLLLLSYLFHSLTVFLKCSLPSVLSAFCSHLCCDSSPWFYSQILEAANARWMPLALSVAMFFWLQGRGHQRLEHFDKVTHKPAVS